MTANEEIFQKTGKELKKPEYKLLKLFLNDPEQIDHEREVMPFRRQALPPRKSVGLQRARVFHLKKYQVVEEKLPPLTSKFPAYQSRAAEQEERNKTARSMKHLQNRIRKPEMHMNIVMRGSLIERDRIPKVDIQQTFATYAEIEFDNDEYKKEKAIARDVVSRMDKDSARKYDNELVEKAWKGVLLGAIRVAKYFHK